jgi:hypothetical protein
MNTLPAQLENTIQEYAELLDFSQTTSPEVANLQWTHIQNKLQTDAGWTNQGAKHITRLARDYGSFVLRNALALAVALDIEDGRFGL